MDENPVAIFNAEGSSPVVLVCEHASAHIPARYGGLGLPPEAAESHAAWDPGALGVARHLSDLLDAPLVASTVSRLVYDCNRPPSSDTAIRELSEIHEVPGNRDLSPEARQERVDTVYRPFEAALAGLMDQRGKGVLVTVHSFTPVYHGKTREVQLGILHDSDARLADLMLARAQDHTAMVTRRNDPYGPEDGVTHTLKHHAIPRGWANVMLEFRNDLIATPLQHQMIAGATAALVKDALLALDTANITETG
ncbi:N-formylglutamate amidohydrolase [Aliiroseovarius sp.]|uniref:N-formylglutamate amidohydrolase n=1 Tax=Aliiroseovarius sp. TaxID=1872442 RepID=UPI003BAD0AD6